MVDRADPDFSPVARWLVDLCQQLRARSVYLQSVLDMSIRRPGLHVIVTFAVEIKDNEGDAEEGLEDPLENAETKFEKASGLFFWQARHHFLQDNLRILGAAQLVEKISIHRPFGSQPWPHRDDSHC